jgi:hypothetical protein
MPYSFKPVNSTIFPIKISYINQNNLSNIFKGYNLGEILLRA